MTSWRPYWCSKTMTRGHLGVPNQPCWKLFSYVNAFFFFLNICKDAGHVSEKALASLLDNQFPASLFLPSSEALGTRLAF